eukprot:Nk52_evm91s151 gene=Nk52_evmTU91s151
MKIPVVSSVNPQGNNSGASRDLSKSPERGHKLLIKDLHAGDLSGPSSLKFGMPEVEVERVNVSGVVVKRTCNEKLTSFVIEDCTDQVEVVVANRFKPMALNTGDCVEVTATIEGEAEGGERKVLKARRMSIKDDAGFETEHVNEVLSLYQNEYFKDSSDDIVSQYEHLKSRSRDLDQERMLNKESKGEGVDQ